MNCKQAREYLFDMEAGTAPAAAQNHVRSCTACAAELASLRQTMSLLDSWQVPEPSPYFDSRLSAKLRAEAATPVSWWEMLRKPAMALALTVIVAMGVMIHGGRSVTPANNAAANEVRVMAQPGTAVGDLLSLDKNHDLLANIELLDDIAGSDQGGQLNP